MKEILLPLLKLKGDSAYPYISFAWVHFWFDSWSLKIRIQYSFNAATIHPYSKSIYYFLWTFSLTIYFHTFVFLMNDEQI